MQKDKLFNIDDKLMGLVDRAISNDKVVNGSNCNICNAHMMYDGTLRTRCKSCIELEELVGIQLMKDLINAFKRKNKA